MGYMGHFISYLLNINLRISDTKFSGNQLASLALFGRNLFVELVIFANPL